MPVGRIIAFVAAIFSPFFLSVFVPQGYAQQKKEVASTTVSAEVAFRTWLASFEKSGARVTQAYSRYDATTGTLTVQGLTIAWPQSSGANAVDGKLELRFDAVSLSSFQSDSQGVTFQSLVAENVTLSSSGAGQPGIKIAHFRSGRGQIPSLTTFVADPTKPFTTQIRLMRLLAGASLDNASAEAIDVGGTTHVASAKLEGLGGAKARLISLNGVQSTGSPSGATPVANNVSSEQIEITNIDFDVYLRLFEPNAYLDRGSARTWSNMVEAIRVRELGVENGPVIFKLSSAQAGPLKVKQFDEILTDIFDRAAIEPGFLAANPESANKLATSVRDAFALEAISGEGIAVEGQNQSGPVNGSLAKVAIDSFTANGISRVKAENLEIADTTGQVTLKTLDLGGINLVAVQTDPVKTSRDANTDVALQTIVPTISSVKALGLLFKLQGVAASLDSFELTMAYFVGAMPTNISANLSHLKFRTNDMTDTQVKQVLNDLGYNELDVSLDFSGSWDDTSSSLVVHNANVTGESMGTLSLAGVVTGITRAGIEAPGMLPSQIFSGGVKSISLVFENDSLFDRFISQVAKKNDKSVDDVKRLLSTNMPAIMSGISPAELRNKFVFAAISFLNNPQVFSLISSSSDVTLVQDLAAALGQPASLPGMMKLDASANSRRN